MQKKQTLEERLEELKADEVCVFKRRAVPIDPPPELLALKARHEAAMANPFEAPVAPDAAAAERAIKKMIADRRAVRDASKV